jgi:hypothetical protein
MKVRAKRASESQTNIKYTTTMKPSSAIQMKMMIKNKLIHLD